MTDPIDLGAERNRREAPEPHLVTHDDYGRPLYRFFGEYERADGSTFAVDFWAYDFADAKAACEGMSRGVTLKGQVFGEVPE